MWTRIAQSLTEVANRPISQFWLDAALKATVLLLAAIGATALLRRQSAALRHRLWCLTFAALVMLPGLSAALPKWRLAVLPYTSPLATREGSQSPPPPEATVAADPEFAKDGFAAQDGLPLAEREDDGTLPSDAQRRVLPALAPAAPRFRLRLITLWLGGALLAVSPLAVGLLRTLQLRRKARAIDDASWASLLEELRGRLRLARRVELIETEAAVMPMTWGLRRPVVLLPRQAREWPDRLRRIVLLHELAHIKRCDVAFQTLGRLACALYWFHPLAWYALRRLRIERELACDDCVVHTGERASDYAAELLQVARCYRPIRFAAAVAMAQRSNLEHRLLALFDRARSHLPLSVRGARLLLAGVMVLATTVAAVRLAPRAAAGDDAPAVTPDNISLESAEDLVTVSGRVVDPKGKPVAGAKIFAVRWYWDSSIPHAPLAETKSDAQGRFSIAFRKSQFDVDVQQADQWKNTQIVARAAGFGPQWVTWRELVPGQDAALRLATDDVPIEGRVVDLEGRPIAGVQVRTSRIDAANNESLDAWLAAISRGELPDTAFSQMRDMLQTFEGWSPQTSTDRDGHFELHGLGRERAVHLALIDPTVAYGSPIVVTRRMEPIQRRESRTTDKSETIYGARCLLVAPPTQPISGVIRDATTHEPLAGVIVASMRLGGVWDSYRTVHAVTDKAGRYRLTGMPKGKENDVIVVPNDDQPYFMREMEVPETDGLDPIALDIDLPRGIWISGHISDLSTGQPVIARLHYFPFLSNEFAQAAFGSSGNVYGSGFQNRYSSRADGSYRLVGLPGRAIVGVASILRPYCAGVGADHIAGLNNRGTFDTYRNALAPGKKWPHTLKEINPPPGVESFHCDLSLDPGASRIVEVVDSDGKPLVGYEVEGRTAYYEPSSPPAQKSSVEIVNLGVDETRTVLIRHKERKLAKILRVRLNDHPERPLTVTAERSARVIGRLIDENGEPIAGAAIEARVRPSGNFTKHLAPVASDRQGRFDYAGIPTGCDYDLIAEAAGISYASVADDLRLIAGETKDLGDVMIGGEKKPAQPASNNESRSTPAAGASDAQIVTLRGRVLLPDGKPAAGADLYWPNAESPPPRTAKEIKYVKRGATDAEGRFQVALSADDTPASGLALYLVAHQRGFGIDWLKVENGEIPADITMRLVEDRPIRGRVTDTEGRPIAGARLSVNNLWASREGNLDDFLTAWNRNWHDSWQKLDHRLHSPLDAIIGTASDRDGRFELSCIGRERVASVEILSAGYAADQLRIVNRDGFDAAKYNEISRATLSPRMRQAELYPRLASPDFHYVAEAEFVVRGKVFTGPDQTPVTGAVVQSYARGDGQVLSVRSDDHGHYDLRGLPRNRQSLVSVSLPPDSDLLARTISLAAAPAQVATDLDVELMRGVIVEGRVFDQGTGRGLKSGVRFVPLPGNKFADQPGYDNHRRNRVWESTDVDGRFRLVVIPGPGVLMGDVFGGPRIGDREICAYRQASFSESERQRVLPTEDGEDRYFATADISSEALTDVNAVKVIEMREGGQKFTCDLPVDAGKTLTLTIEDHQGKPVANCLVAGLADTWPAAVRIAEPAFTVYGLGADRPRRVCILHPEHKLAASITLTGEEHGPMTVRLGAAASIVGRALDSNGEPIDDAVVQVNYARRGARSLNQFAELELTALTTDGQGRFRAENVLPGERFALDFKQADAYFRANLTDEQRQLKAGQRLELGDVEVKQIR